MSEEKNISDNVEQPSAEALEKIENALSTKPGTIRLIREVYRDFDESLIEQRLPLQDKVKAIIDFAKEKSPQEVFREASQKYDSFIQEEDWSRAYNLSRAYLSTEMTNGAAEPLFESNLQLMRNQKGESKERRKAAKQVIDPKYLPEIERSSELVEETLELLYELRDKKMDKRKGFNAKAFYSRQLRYSEAANWLKEPENPDIKYAVWWVKKHSSN